MLSGQGKLRCYGYGQFAYFFKYKVKLYVFHAMRCMGMVIILIVYSTQPTYAVFQHPDQIQVKKALERGMDFAHHHRPLNELN